MSKEVKCPHCASTDVTAIRCVACGDNDWEDGDYKSLDRCKNCGFQTDEMKYKNKGREVKNSRS